MDIFKVSSENSISVKLNVNIFQMENPQNMAEFFHPDFIL